MPLLTLLAPLVAALPFADLAVVGAPLAWSAGSLLRIRRAHVEDALRAAGIAAVPGAAAAMYEALATGVMELLWLAGAPRRPLAGVVALDDDGRAILDVVRARARGCGVVFAASHTGNWELTACAMAQELPLSVLVKPISVGAFDRFVRTLRARYGVGLIEGEGALVRARGELRAGRSVAVLVDQVPASEPGHAWIPFLGGPALTDHTAAVLAASAGAPLVTTVSRRCEDGRHRVGLLGVKWPPAETSGTGRAGRAWADAATREITAELEAFVRAYPDQWLWMHRRWRRPLSSAPASLVSTQAGR